MSPIARTAELCAGALAVLALWALPAAARPQAAPPRVKVVATKLAQPLYLTAPASEPSRQYIVLRNGLVRVLVNGRLRARPFLDLRSRVAREGERGLLSLAFSPRYATDGLVYVCYTGHDGAINVVELRASAGVANPGTARVLLRVPHDDSPFHNGGQLAFGPDGMLYAGFGDGGYTVVEGYVGIQPDPHGNSQNLGVLLGKIVRLDVSQPAPTPELVAYGLRNPWRFSFTPSGDLVIGDVGWTATEEIDVLRAGTTAPVNFGWSVYEGRRRRTRGPTVELDPAGTLTWPAHTYSHAGGCSITGGYVYRGRRVARLRGRYVFGDYCSGRIWSLRLVEGRATGVRREPMTIRNLASFGEDAKGDLYAISLSGTVYRIVR